MTFRAYYGMRNSMKEPTVHYSPMEYDNYGICGCWADHKTENPHDVTCGRCRNSRVWRRITKVRRTNFEF